MAKSQEVVLDNLSVYRQPSYSIVTRRRFRGVLKMTILYPIDFLPAA